MTVDMQAPCEVCGEQWVAAPAVQFALSQTIPVAQLMRHSSPWAADGWSSTPPLAANTGWNMEGTDFLKPGIQMKTGFPEDSNLAQRACVSFILRISLV